MILGDCRFLVFEFRRVSCGNRFCFGDFLGKTISYFFLGVAVVKVIGWIIFRKFV